MPLAGELAEARERTQRHYDRHPFGFDQEEILAEKLERRVMGEAIRRTSAPALVLDVGCGACSRRPPGAPLDARAHDWTRPLARLAARARTNASRAGS